MAQREQVFQGQPPIFGGARLLPSPSQFFVTGEDRLRIVSSNSAAGVTLKVQWRTALFSGDVVPNSELHTPNTDRTTKTQDFELGTGSLLNVTVFASSGSPLIGQTYVMVQIIRGQGATAIVLGTLLAGYVTVVQALGFPGSPITPSTEGEPYLRTITGSAPAAGANITETVPAGARWELLSWSFALTTSAVVADRKPYFQRVVAAANFGAYVNFSTIPASSFGNFSFGPNLPSTSDPINQLYQAAFAEPMLFLAGHQLVTGARNLAAGDQFSVVTYMVREWLEVA